MQIVHRQSIPTFDAEKNQTGYIIPIFTQGNKTVVYLNVFFPKAFKGYHVHTEQTNRVYCLAGEVVIYIKDEDHITVTPLSANSQDCVTIPIQTPIAYENLGMGNSVLIISPNPPYNPTNTGEMIPLGREEVEKSVLE